MKLFFFLLLLNWQHHYLAPLLLIDTGFKSPAKSTEDFTWEQYIQKKFPIYAEDREIIIAAAEKTAKKLNSDIPCSIFDTIRANHSNFIIYMQCEPYKMVTVRIQTTLEEKKMSCDFELIKNEGNSRKAQKKLLDFADYLSHWQPTDAEKEKF